MGCLHNKNYSADSPAFLMSRKKHHDVAYFTVGYMNVILGI